MVFFEFPGIAADPDKRHHARGQHIAFDYETLDDLLGTYVRLRGLEFMPVMPSDGGLQTSLYYTDPDGNSIELNVNKYRNDWTATEHMRTAAPSAGQPRRVFVDAEKMVAARKACASACAACRRRRGIWHWAPPAGGLFSAPRPPVAPPSMRQVPIVNATIRMLTTVLARSEGRPWSPVRPLREATPGASDLWHRLPGREP